MNDKLFPPPPVGAQIRRLRQERGFTLAECAKRSGTSAPTLHRYENGWDRFEQDTLRRIAAALDARLEIRLVPTASPPPSKRPPSRKALTKTLAPLFWERDLRETDLVEYAGWVLERVLTSGNREQVAAARTFFGDEAIRRAVERRGVDPRTRQYWRLMLGGAGHAPQSSRH